MRFECAAHIGIATFLLLLNGTARVMAGPSSEPTLPQVKDLPLDKLKTGLAPYVALLSALGTIYFFVMTWKHGLSLARSGDDPGAKADAMEALLIHLLGGVLFFGASLFASLLHFFVYN